MVDLPSAEWREGKTRHQTDIVEQTQEQQGLMNPFDLDNDFELDDDLDEDPDEDDLEDDDFDQDDDEDEDPDKDDDEGETWQVGEEASGGPCPKPRLPVDFRL